jgi:hypothetical protein
MTTPSVRTPVLALLFVLGVLTGLIAPRELHADQARTTGGELIALTTAGARGEDMLILVDPAEQYLSAYVVDGRGVHLVAGRSFSQDHPAEVLSWYSRRGSQELTPEAVQELIRKARK